MQIQLKKRNIMFFLVITFLIILFVKGCNSGKSRKSVFYDVTIDVKYEESTGFNYKDNAKLYVDDKEIAEIKNGSEGKYVVPLTKGQHKIYLKRDAAFRKNSTNKIKIKVTSDNRYFSITAKENTVLGLRISKN